MDQQNWQQRTALFLASQSISIFGSTVVGFVIIWHVTLETSSGKWMTLSILCSMLPQMVVSLFAGVVADRFNRKHIAMAADALIALATLGLALAFFGGYGSLRLLLAVSVLRSAGAGLQAPAVSAIYPQIVPREYLTRVNGIYHSIHSLFMLLSPAIGAMMLDYIGISWAFMLDVVTAGIAIAILAALKIERPQETERHQSALADLKRGLAFTFGHPLLKPLLICYALFFLLHTPVSFLTPIMIERSFGSEAWRLSANEIVWSVGSLAGGLFVSLHGKFDDKVRIIGRSIMAFGFCFAMLGVVGNFWLYMLVMGIAGVFLPILSTAQTVLIQENVAEDMMGRVFSVLHIISSGMMPLGMLFFGPLGDLVRIERILAVTGSLQIVVGCLYAMFGHGKNAWTRAPR